MDPRIGRGPFSTFDATKPAWFRWPLDYVFYTDDFSLCRLQLLDDIGSDHVPLLAEAVLQLNTPSAHSWRTGRPATSSRGVPSRP